MASLAQGPGGADPEGRTAVVLRAVLCFYLDHVRSPSGRSGDLRSNEPGNGPGLPTQESTGDAGHHVFQGLTRPITRQMSSALLTPVGGASTPRFSLNCGRGFPAPYTRCRTDQCGQSPKSKRKSSQSKSGPPPPYPSSQYPFPTYPGSQQVPMQSTILFAAQRPCEKHRPS